MATVTKCLREIRAVMEVARGTEAAYVARSRVARLGLSVARLVSDAVGRRPPERLGKLPVSRGVEKQVGDVIDLGNAVQELAEVIRQPSEPLDGRWVAMWQELEWHLDSLEKALLNLDTKNASRHVGARG